MLSSLGWSTLFDAESRRNAAFTSDSEQPRRASPRGARRLLTTTRRSEPALSMDQFGNVSIDHIIASALVRVLFTDLKITVHLALS